MIIVIAKQKGKEINKNKAKGRGFYSGSTPHPDPLMFFPPSLCSSIPQTRKPQTLEAPPSSHRERERERLQATATATGAGSRRSSGGVRAEAMARRRNPIPEPLRQTERGDKANDDNDGRVVYCRPPELRHSQPMQAEGDAETGTGSKESEP